MKNKLINVATVTFSDIEILDLFNSITGWILQIYDVFNDLFEDVVNLSILEVSNET